MCRVGILGGTFDPPHYGHLIIAEEARVACQLDEVWFMPSHIPPHKKRADLSSNEDRVEMVRLAISDHDSFHITKIELEREGPSYTVDTMKQLTNMYPTYHFHFIIGGDMIDYLPKWHGIEELLELVTFIGLKRPGYPSHSPYQEKIIEIGAPQLEISSSEIRKRTATERNTRYMLPDVVRAYVKERDLYGKKCSSRDG
ncbi:nicotinate-nucleotide adenylyltransferase [Desertibacillus haloalkaliphilus]|uniref:nicotinate-nucleotide adenylyltransferase n=1 Tax=Desertibacillus haloalkaliphilus TaxID=1328930 RepID=UPI001C27F6F7|nr:nicotinate-nucleotide adenylyltransferase [Desertibacillus haloalkaliphilus]MBU8905611.1 nicotinate-nucleotide adenylyltransferase [Desertibacillus haloalkaliphilus]